ncbi:MAG: hydrogenase expression/formation protein HypE, partial [Coleofasciculus sp.]|uniref:hydrogenase expression/formation protein HypE n=1 Tax=Coleofasciculus sp. TaxID=3100458 RepID=UPI003A4AE8C6
MTHNQNPLFQKIEQIRRRPNKIKDTAITLAHGSGGKAMRDLIDDIFVGSFDNPILSQLEDQATIPLAQLISQGDRLAFTTDSYVVDPLFFPGSNIGELAINGTVNDLAVSGAKPLYLTCSMIMEEGLPVETLRQVVLSMKTAADAAGVKIVTGDTKVVHRGSADKLFINTAGIGVIREGVSISAHHIQPGDAVIINGQLGNHGAAILIARGELALST